MIKPGTLTSRMVVLVSIQEILNPFQVAGFTIKVYQFYLVAWNGYTSRLFQPENDVIFTKTPFAYLVTIIIENWRFIDGFNVIVNDYTILGLYEDLTALLHVYKHPMSAKIVGIECRGFIFMEFL
mgnify:CR=1 FL=1